jgi:hypothetical protein
VAEVHAEDLVSGLQHGGVDGEVGLRAGVRLDVGVLGVEEFFGALDGEHLDLVHLLAAAIPALGRVTLGVFVGEHRAHGLDDGRVGEVFRGDQLDVALLAGELAGDHGVNFGIKLGQGGGVQGHGGSYDFRITNYERLSKAIHPVRNPQSEIRTSRVTPWRSASSGTLGWPAQLRPFRRAQIRKASTGRRRGRRSRGWRAGGETRGTGRGAPGPAGPGRG